MAIGLAIKGVASLFPKNTIVNKLANAPTSIKANDIKNAIADVKGSVSGSRGLLGGNTPSVNLLGKAGVKTTPAPSVTQGGLNTLQPSTLAVNSALASQKSVAQSLSAGAMGASAPTTPNYASDFGSVDASNPDGIKATGSIEINPYVLAGGALAIYLITKKR